MFFPEVWSCTHGVVNTQQSLQPLTERTCEASELGAGPFAAGLPELSWGRDNYDISGLHSSPAVWPQSPFTSPGAQAAHRWVLMKAAIPVTPVTAPGYDGTLVSGLNLVQLGAEPRAL